jgi:thiamine pyrophosphate-dependent acetolactate synthase large subunit-like protein
LQNEAKVIADSSKKEPKVDGGYLVATTLRKFGTKHIFTLCGGHITPILRGCYKNEIRVVDFRDERSAAFAAMGTSIVTGIPGVVVVTAGPGLTNTFTAVKTAIHAQVPLVVIAGAAATFLKGRGSLQDTEQIGYFIGGEAVKWAKTVETMREIPHTLSEAFSRSQSGVPGPVLIEIPMDILYGPDLEQSQDYRNQILKSCGKGPLGWFKKKIVELRFEDMWDMPEELSFPAPQIFRPELELDDFKKVERLIKSAERPILLLGSQIVWSRAKDKIKILVENLRIPTYLNGLARGILGEKNPMFFKNSRSFAFANADLVILAGVSPDFRLNYGKAINRKAKIIRIDLDPYYLSKNIPTALKLQCDIGLALESLEALGIVFPNKNWTDKLRKVETEMETSLRGKAEAASKGINPVRLFFEIRNFVNENTILVVDGGDFVGIASKIIEPNGVARWLDAGPFGALGCGIGFAAAAKIAKPESEVIAIFGDGAFGYSLIEFSTLVRHRIPIVTIIGNDGAWTQIKRSDEEIYKDSVSIGTHIGQERYEEAVEAFNAWGRCLWAEEDLENYLKGVFAVARSGLPALLNVKIAPADLRKGSISV